MKDYLNKIICDDFRNVFRKLPDNSLIITDPPYNIGVKYGEYGDSLSEVEYSNMFVEFLGLPCVFIHYPEETIRYLCSSLGCPSEIVSWVYNSNTKKQHRLISWFNCSPDFSKITQPYKNTNDKRIRNLMLRGGDCTPIYDWWNIELVKNVSREKVNYKNQIPEEIISRIIKTTANKGVVIIDPFCGSGTTCVVAKKLGFDFIGIDQSKGAVRIAEKRLAQTELFTPELIIDEKQEEINLL